MSERTAILAIVGASAAGKTTVVRELAERSLPGVSVHYFDSVGVPSVEEMERTFGSGEAWQAAITDRWVEQLAASPPDVEVAVLEGQTRPSFVQAAFARSGVRRTSIVLLDCSPAVRSERLHGPRNQPELATVRMDSWSAYLRGQADALGLPVLDTGRLDLAAIVDALVGEIDRLRGGSLVSTEPRP